jgi:hypothetical protein
VIQVKKEILRIENDDFQKHMLFYAIASSHSDIRMCQSINQVLGINLALSSNVEIVQKNKIINFRRYIYESDEEIEKYTLVVNRNEGAVLFRELQMIDYILIVNTEGPKDYIESLLQELRNTSDVTALYKLDHTTLKTFNRLAF